MRLDQTQVPAIAPLDHHLYLAPGAQTLVRLASRDLPATQRGCVRLVCVGDTHNEHEGLQLPDGDVLVHAGDVLTASGMRHVSRSTGQLRGRAAIRDEGLSLFHRFAKWLGAQRFAHKVVIAGNHDLVLQELGSDEVQSILTKHCSYGEVIYLEHQEAKIGRLRIFGSPYADYKTKNNAFSRRRPKYDVKPGVHVVVTHMPAVVPSRKRPRESQLIATAAMKAGALLHVGGHCHWAHGLHFFGDSTSQLPCVVASVCGREWKSPTLLKSCSGMRGDPQDATQGGYNIENPSIICDIRPGKEVDFDEQRRAGKCQRRRHSVASPFLSTNDHEMLPSLLFFCPPTDPGLSRVLLRRLRKHFRVVYVENAADGVKVVGEQQFAACVAKLGCKGNLGYDVVAALRSSHGRAPFVAIHSATAAANSKFQEQLEGDLGIDMFTEHGRESELLDALVKRWSTRDYTLHQITRNVAGEGPDHVHSLLFFCPSTDPGLRGFLLPQLREKFRVICVDAASAAMNLVEEHAFAACVAKLGSKGNLGCEVVAALRSAQGRTPFVAIHSATAAVDVALQSRMASKLGVDLFTRHGQEEDLLARLAPLSIRP